jgi:hypothetical protein
MTGYKENPFPGETSHAENAGWDDIESELYCSAREASLECLSFAEPETQEGAIEMPVTVAQPMGLESAGPVDTMEPKQCPECGGERVIPVIAERRSHFFCRDCYQSGDRAPYLFR